MSSKFIRTKENFICEKCGTRVKGNGYTNHCPECLWSKHVDVFPGDRKGECLGMMKPVEVDVKSNEHLIVHKCLTCGHTKPNKVAEEDNFDTLIRISAENSKYFK